MTLVVSLDVDCLICCPITASITRALIVDMVCVFWKSVMYPVSP